MLDATYLPHFMALVMFGAFAHGFMGLGFGIIVIAGLAFTGLSLERASVVLNLLLPVLFATVLFASSWDLRFKIKGKLTLLLCLGSFLGVPLGYWFLYTQGNQPVFYLALGLTLALFSVNYLLRPRINTQLPLWIGFVAALAGGFLAGAFTAGGPPLALFLYSHFENPSEAKGTLQIIFLNTTWWRLINIGVFSEGFTWQIFSWAGLLAVLVVIFAFLGHWAARRVSPLVFGRVVYSFIGLAGAANIIRYFSI
jgi:uncharacterized membrane protein YfcA